jgi:hypothetical protein
VHIVKTDEDSIVAIPFFIYNEISSASNALIEIDSQHLNNTLRLLNESHLVGVDVSNTNMPAHWVDNLGLFQALKKEQ